MRLGVRLWKVECCFSITEENKQIKRKVSFSVKFKMLKGLCVNVQVEVANVTLRDGGMCCKVGIWRAVFEI